MLITVITVNLISIVINLEFITHIRAGSTFLSLVRLSLKIVIKLSSALINSFMLIGRDTRRRKIKMESPINGKTFKISIG